MNSFFKKGVLSRKPLPKNCYFRKRDSGEVTHLNTTINLFRHSSSIHNILISFIFYFLLLGLYPTRHSIFWLFELENYNNKNVYLSHINVKI